MPNPRRIMHKSPFQKVKIPSFCVDFPLFAQKIQNSTFLFSIIRKKARFVALFSFFAGFPLSAKRLVRRMCDIFREVAWGLVKRTVFASFLFSSCYFLHFQGLSACAAFRAFAFSSFFIYSSVVTSYIARDIDIKQRQNLRFCRVTARENDDRQKVSFCRKNDRSCRFSRFFFPKRQGTFPFFPRNWHRFCGIFCQSRQK